MTEIFVEISLITLFKILSKEMVGPLQLREELLGVSNSRLKFHLRNTKTSAYFGRTYYFPGFTKLLLDYVKISLVFQ